MHLTHVMLGVLLSFLLSFSTRAALALASLRDAVPARQLEPAATDVQGASKGAWHPANSAHVGRVHEQKGEERAVPNSETLYGRLVETLNRAKSDGLSPKD